MVHYYHALVSHVDDQVGRILATLEATGLARRTIVIFTSDHGEYLGDHGRIQKGMPHSVITNVPCIVRLPGDPLAGETVTEVVEQIDVTATILDYCGVQVPRFVQGCSLRPLLDGGGAWRKSAALTEAFSEYGGSGSVTLQTALTVRLRHRRPGATVRQAGGPRRAAQRRLRGALRGGARRVAPPVGRAAAAGALQRPSARRPLLSLRLCKHPPRRAQVREFAKGAYSDLSAEIGSSRAAW